MAVDALRDTFIICPLTLLYDVFAQSLQLQNVLQPRDGILVLGQRYCSARPACSVECYSKRRISD